MGRAATSLVVGLCWAPALGYADSIVYVSTGDSGETVYSDVVSPDARRIEMTESESHPLSSAEQVAHMLAVANDLAEARAAREAERAAKRKSARPPVPLHRDFHTPGLEPYHSYAYFHPLTHIRKPHRRVHKPDLEPQREPKRMRFTPRITPID